MPKHQALPSKAQKNQAADAGCAKWSKGFHAPNYIFEPAPAISEQAAPDSRHASFQRGVWKGEEDGGEEQEEEEEEEGTACIAPPTTPTITTTTTAPTTDSTSMTTTISDPVLRT